MDTGSRSEDVLMNCPTHRCEATTLLLLIFSVVGCINEKSNRVAKSIRRRRFEWANGSIIGDGGFCSVEECNGESTCCRPSILDIVWSDFAVVEGW